RFVAGPARHQDAADPDAAAQRQRAGAGAVPERSPEGAQGVLPGAADAPAVRAREEADARLRRDAGLRRRLAGGGAPGAERGPADGARREPWRSRDVDFPPRLDDARQRAGRSAQRARHHRRPGPDLGRDRGPRGSERRFGAGARPAAVIDFILHSDKHLLDFVSAYGAWVYALLFGIVFAETGFVVTPFLPGDSLLFATGALAATGVLSAPAAFGLLFLAAFAGNAVNYTVGRFVGPRVFTQEGGAAISHRLLNREHLQRAHEFFETYGGKAVVLGRFVPIVRTFVPFVAGAARMTPASFGFYNLLGAAGWVGLCLGAGLLFGNVPIVKQNFSLVTIGIVFVSLLPMLFEIVSQRRNRPTPDRPPTGSLR